MPLKLGTVGHFGIAVRDPRKSARWWVKTLNVRQWIVRRKLVQDAAVTLGLTPEQIELEKKRDSLLLSRTRVLHDLENCRDERYRKTLAEGLSYLEEQLAALGWLA